MGPGRTPRTRHHRQLNTKVADILRTAGPVRIAAPNFTASP